MQYEFAPMEGITGYVYRNAHNRHFGGADRYFLPFLLPNQNHSFTSREKKDILPKHNQTYVAIPQVLTNRAEDFLWASRELADRGYGEINLNLGCPSGTVVSKKKGAGFLGCVEELDRFLDEVCRKMPIKLSVKARLGLEEPEEIQVLLPVFNRYPIEELILHPRVRRDFYQGEVRREWFSYVLEESVHPVSYNGDLFTAQALWEAQKQYPKACAMMLGRGVLTNPGLFREARGGEPMTLKELEQFHWDLYESYQQEIPGGQNVLFKMKELWFYMFHMLDESSGYEKQMRKVRHVKDYESLVKEIFLGGKIKDKGAFVPPKGK